MENRKFAVVTGIMGLMFLGLMNMAYPSSSIGATNCPDTFVGKVQNVADENQDADNPFKKVRVEFQDLGKSGGLREIKTLKHGENDFQEGDTYKIGLRSGYICEVTKLSEHSN